MRCHHASSETVDVTPVIWLELRRDVAEAASQANHRTARETGPTTRRFGAIEKLPGEMA